MPGFDNGCVYFENGIDPRGTPPVANQMSDGKLLIGSNVAPYVIANSLSSSDSSVTITGGPGTIDLKAGSAVPTTFVAEDASTCAPVANTLNIVGTAGNGINTTAAGNTLTIGADFASSTETKVGTSTAKVVNPSTFSSYMDDLTFSGIQSWTGAGAYFDDTTLGTFTLLRGGTGYCKGKLITFSGAQSVTGLTAGNCYFIYIDSSGVLQKSSTFSLSLFTDNIVLFECLRDSTPVTNNQVTVREDHPHNFQSAASVYLHEAIGSIIQNTANGANITLNGTQKIQINGADVLLDHGLSTTIPDSGGAAVTFYKYYTTAAGKWARYTATDSFTGHYNNAGTVTALTAGRFAVYTLYCSKDKLNSATPFYYAVLDTAQYTSLGNANTAISNGTTAKSSNELSALEVCQLGYIIYRESTASIVQVTISKSTLKQTLSTSGSNTAALIQTNVTNFNGWLDSTDTNVQAALDELDDSRRATEVTAASQTLAINRSYSANRGTLVTFTLPTVAKVGDEIAITGIGAGGWLIAQNANQYINVISSTTTIGVGGSLASTQKFDSVKLVCVVANLGWNLVNGCGNWTLA